MTKDIFLLGSTGSIGETTLKVIKKDKSNFKVKLLSTNKNAEKVYKQAIQFGVKKVVIFDKKSYLNNFKKFKGKKIKIFLTIKEALKKNKKKSFLTVNGIAGIEGLEPTLDIIKYSNNLAMANKESIICGWQFIRKELQKRHTRFVPLDSEHFSISSLIKDESKKNIKKIYLTASGGPFLYKNLKNIKNIKPKFALNHPNWKMGKKISIDSATLMNKIFEIIEAIKIFDMERSKFDILIHPKSYLHAIVNFKNGLTKLVAHETTMQIPIANALYLSKNNYIYNSSNFNYHKLNSLNFIKPNIKNFPLLKILNYKFKNTYFEIILVSINDMLVKNYLLNKISYISIHNKMLELLKKPYFIKYYSSKPKNIKDIKSMVEIVNQYIIKNLKVND
jgi:1-deoxy-D-xylulose-5-phosphate reductoisomerase